MNKSIREHLDYLYGADVASALEQPIAALVREFALPPGSTPAARQSLALTERDALLITYGDQVREPGAPPLRTLAEFAGRRLDGVVSGIHILPFYPWSSDDGFSVKDFFAVDSELGTWDDVDLFRRKFDLMFDAVFNHMSAQSEWFRRFLRDDPEFRDFFVTVEGAPDLSRVVRPRALPLLTAFETVSGPKQVWTTFSADQVDLNFDNPRVLLAMLRALLFYVARGAKFIRLDAIAYLCKEIGTTCIHLPRTHRTIQLMRAVLDEIAPGVMLITETNVPHADNLSYFGDGANEAQLVYNFALPPLVFHSIAAGNAEKLTRWAASLQLPSPRVAFFNFLASHDGIGLNPARGILSDGEIDRLVERAQAHGGYVSYKHNADGSKSPYELNVNYFDALSNPAAGESPDTQVNRFMAAQAVMLSLIGMPGIYFHSLFGSRNDRAGAESSGIPRRINRQKLLCEELERELAAPLSLRARVFGAYRTLLAVRRGHPAFHPASGQEVLDCDPRVFALWRAPNDTRAAFCAHNLSNGPVELTLPHERFGGKRWRNLITGDTKSPPDTREWRIRLQPYEVLWLAPP